MDNIIVNKGQLLDKLRQNREKHARDHKESVLGFREETLKLLRKTARLIKAGKPITYSLPLHEPDNHLVEYDRTIAMLEMDTQPTVSLTPHEFDRYVNDQWTWKQEFDFTTSNYAGKARRG